MQKLKFEDAWDRTISLKDREEITRIFQESVDSLEEGIIFTPVWIAENYKKEQLLTVIVHNQTSEDLLFEDTILQFCDGEVVLEEHSFTIPAVHVVSRTSMPWTFIFPESSVEAVPIMHNISLRVKREK
ncbi:SLAP domain-containing protein [Ferdinandcohnia sp. Marseille-Q9671]